METWKLVLLYLAWLFASGAIAVIFGVFAGEILWFLGIVELDDGAYRVVVDVVVAISFVLLALTPWFLRHRLMRDEEVG